MGVKTVITLADLPQSLEITSLEASKDGVMDSVYFLNDNRVLKIFENTTAESVKEELKLLTHCETLPVPKPNGEIFRVQNKPALIYHRCQGKSLKSAEVGQIRQIGTFLQAFHTLTAARQSTNEPLFERSRLKRMIEESNVEIFDTLLKKIDLRLRNDGIIHGDLFMDNALFKGESLSCVIDFTQACNGDFLFDLAVAGLSWCDSDEKTEALLESYGATITLEAFRPYREYATLFYSVNRYLNGGNYQELLEKLV
ncbi:MAG: phosphotransferase [Sulfuricurvum sp.]|uniref:phosphotransferase n=1 Tax=Sulfuricurvum sp. TaxID=2025608 RepID=UPI0027345635|nr:phosphotransferase [Sulfuricurvum sp.]MDP3292708.1 phosphotransferase [Sulfuricurvum sp.]